MDDSEAPGSPETSATAGERFSSFTKRNVVLVAVFFLSNLLTAVSTLVTAVTVLRETGTDWRAAEYRKLRQLRAGYTLEKFRQELGPPVFRTPLEGGGPFVRNVYHPREEYWVEAISDKSNAAMTYAVTTCDPAFRPEFFFGGDDKTRIVLNENTLSDVLPAEWERDQSLQLSFGGTRSTPQLAFHVFGGGGPSHYREFAWGLNDVCSVWRSRTPGYDVRASWKRWFEAQKGYEEPLGTFFLPEKLDKGARGIMAESVVNTYAETVAFQDMLRYYPIGIGVDVLTVQ
ncbi:ETEC_3214 domain-containing protein [Streptomyces hydrogenans]|uniref:ETEC_3214 domain-containing protein n=1 Tax=Streptomyces hydrogenans TaxID=1873719 RepID=UPI003823E932